MKLVKAIAAESLRNPQDSIDLASFSRTDSGNAERLVAMFGVDLRYCHSHKAWYTWTGNLWTEDNRGLVLLRTKEVARALFLRGVHENDNGKREEIVKFALRSENLERRRAMMTAAQSEPSIAIGADAWDRDPWLLNVANGTIDLRTGELRPHRRTDFCAKICPVAYEPGARSELWDRFLLDSTGGFVDYLEFLQRTVGYTITGSTMEEVLFLVHGPSASGKSTLLEALRSVLGDYGRTSDFETFTAKRDAGVRNDIAALVGRRFVVSIEVDEGKRLAEGLVKSITGRDTISARFLYGEYFEFRPQFKLWLACNHAPEVDHTDAAMWRRILRLPFNHTVPPERRDPTLKERLCDPESHGKAVLAWAIEGALKWQRDGLNVPDFIRQETDDYRQEQDPLREFFEDRCTFDPDASIPSKRLYDAYSTWAGDQGYSRPISPNRFGALVRARGCRADMLQRGVRGWRGINLRGAA